MSFEKSETVQFYKMFINSGYNKHIYTVKYIWIQI